MFFEKEKSRCYLLFFIFVINLRVLNINLPLNNIVYTIFILRVLVNKIVTIV